MTDDGGWLALRSIRSNPNGPSSPGFIQGFFRRKTAGLGVATSYGSAGWTAPSPLWTRSTLPFTCGQQTEHGDRAEDPLVGGRSAICIIVGKSYNGGWRVTSGMNRARSQEDHVPGVLEINDGALG